MDRTVSGRRAQWLACGLWVCLVCANVLIKIPFGERSRVPSDAAKHGRAWRGRAAPAFVLTLTNGARYSLDGNSGHRVRVLAFVTSWCGSCEESLLELQRYADRLREAGSAIEVVAVDVQELPNVVAPFIAQAGVTIPVGIDGTGDIARLFEVRAFPTTAVVGADGRVRLYQEGPMLNADVALERIVQAELASLQMGVTP